VVAAGVLKRLLDQSASGGPSGSVDLIAFGFTPTSPSSRSLVAP
jgi:hypothetical protein